MYARYVTNATSVLVDVIADIAKLISGADISTLSGSCNKVATQVIANTVAPGWTIFDGPTASGGYVLSAPDFDAKTTKYVKFDVSGAAIIHNAYETWNAGTHAGTNATSVTGIAALTHSTTTVNTFYILATPRLIGVCLPTGVGLFSFEVARDISYLNKGNYPVNLITSDLLGGTYGSGTNSYLSRIKSMSAAGDVTGASATGYIATASPVALRSGTLRDDTEAIYHAMYPLWYTAFGAGAAVLGRLFDVLMVTPGFGASLDEFTDGTDTYVVLGSGTLRFAIKKA